MKISVDKEQLETLLKDKKSVINKTFKKCTPYFSFALSLLLASFCSDFKDWGFLKADHAEIIYYSIMAISVLIGLYYLIFGIIKPYTYKELYEEIIELSKPHSFAILLIRDDSKYRYLLFNDVRWNRCRLFVNINIDSLKKPKDNSSTILNRLSEDFDIPKKEIKVNYCSSIESRKWSYSDKTTKNYKFHFFVVNINTIPDYMKPKKFSYKDNTYCWASLEEMEKDKKIMKMNKDVVETVKKLKVNL